MKSLWNELKRRNVVRVGVAYIVAAWLLIQVVETIFPLFDFGPAPARIIVVLLAIGFIPALVFAWVFELTTEGLRKESEIDRSQSITLRTGKKLDSMIMLVLALALSYFAFDKFVLDPQREAALLEQAAVQAEEARQEGRTEALIESYGDQSIAVLAFDDMSPEGDQAYLSDGIAEELLNLLAKIPELRVISRSSAFSFKGKKIPIPIIGQELNVAHILEGSVRKSGERIRITAQLIEASSDTHMWSQTYDRELKDIFAIQDEIARAMVEQLRLELLDSVPKPPETDPETYALFLRALKAARSYTVADQTEALELLQKAVVLDPAYANSWALMAVIYRGNGLLRLMPMSESAPLARKAALTALELDPANGVAHSVLVELSISNGDFAAATRSLELALASGRVDPGLVLSAAIMAKVLGQIDKSISILEYAIMRDPLFARYYDELALIYYFVGRREEAMVAAQTAIHLNPDIFRTRGILAWLLLLEGDSEAALVEIEKERWPEMRLIGKIGIYEKLGEKQKSDNALRALTDLAPPGSNMFLYAHVMRGENEVALQWLEQNTDKVLIGVMAEMNHEPLFAEIRQDPRYQRVQHKLGISKEQLAEIDLQLGPLVDSKPKP
jgi:adenylate cyclase